MEKIATLIYKSEMLHFFFFFWCKPSKFQHHKCPGWLHTQLLTSFTFFFHYMHCLHSNKTPEKVQLSFLKWWDVALLSTCFLVQCKPPKCKWIECLDESTLCLDVGFTFWGVFIRKNATLIYEMRCFIFCIGFDCNICHKCLDKHCTWLVVSFNVFCLSLA